ncbi:MBL fold metallo-hydrolase [Amycolatopsis acidicola]|uniref:MBL fold metallo-hydrolase n=1 Tax=Amycolatopsis acidicola TaxID=2596893 RepID=A0A5N0UJ28_9PSEU|nr:MBL fold metallo-hydrolase [Amycolatopsis acidicola]KAA9149021.1 MBL fold metallo-hydrolase [Amycolatopsis acidicola]
MLVVGFATGAFKANCYLLATAAGRGCVVVDPGEDAAAPVRRALAEHELTPEVIVATHGHPDHVASAADLVREHDIPMWIHPGDAGLLGFPAEPLTAGERTFAGLAMTVDPVPGHTSGSVLLRLGTPEGGRLVLTGDTLFAGSIGRGDQEQIGEALRDKVLPLPDDTVVLPGHGAATTIERERAANPFLAVAR